MDGYYCVSYKNFDDLRVHDAETAEKLACRIEVKVDQRWGTRFNKPWMNHELIVYPAEYDFAVYQLQDGLYKEHGFGDAEYESLPDPMDFSDTHIFGEQLAKHLNNNGHYIYTGDCVIESPYGFR